ncbi:NEW3 domain-containing protein [Streptomyces sp. NPDC091292]|uniref:NEW3 domain-containing protein n=1 Tax=Streptomyces sp. NPDC091292 TaxID=3365991 RepID=UPI0038036F75
MRTGGLINSLRAVAVAGAIMLIPGQAMAADTRAEAVDRTEVTIAPVDLDGPAIATVKVTVKNAGPDRMRSLKVSFSGPVGWAVQPSAQEPGGTYAKGAAVDLTFRIQVPEQRPGFRIRTFEATASYRGGDGVGSATGTRSQRTGAPSPNLAAAYNNVAITDENNTAPGNYDGEGNSFSAQKLADVGLVRGARVKALGADLTWPDVPSGSKNNVSGAGQAVALSGSGSKLVLLGSGVTSNAVGSATVYYKDGTSTQGSFGFPNWSFDPVTAHGAILVASSDGRNRPSGYGNAGIKYSVFAHSIPLDKSKEVEFVVLPSNGNVHIFDIALAP